jgi:AraC-like DNA-binding protein
MVRRRFVPIFARFLIPYLICLLIPATFGTILHRRTLDFLQQEEIDRSLANLRQTASILDKRLVDVENLTSHLATDHRIPILKSDDAPLGPYRTMNVVDFVDGLYTFDIAGGFLLDYYILMKRNGLAVGPRQVYRSDYFHRSVVRLAIVYKDANRQALVYLESLKGPEANRGAIIVLIDGRAISELLSSNTAADGGWVTLTDEDGRTMVSAGTEEPVPARVSAGVEGSGVVAVRGQRTIVTHTTLPFKGWRLTAYYPESAVFEKASYVRTLTGTFIAVPLVLGLAVAVTLAYRRSTPVAEAIRALDGRFASPSDTRGDVLSVLHGAVTGLLEDQRALERRLDAQRPLLQAAIVERLLDSDYAEAADIETRFAEVGMRLGPPPYTVALVEVEGAHGGDEGLEVRKLIAKDLLAELLGPEAIVHDRGFERIACITSGRELDSLRFHLHSLCEECERRGVPVAVGLGRPATALTRIAESFEQARTALHAAIHEAAGTPVGYGDLPGGADGFALPSDLLSRLAELVVRQDATAGRAYLADIFEKNAVALQSTEHLERVLLATLLATLLAVRDRLALPAEPTAELVLSASESVIRADDPTDGMAEILALYDGLCESYGTTHRSSNSMLLDSVRTYLEEQFSNKNLTLTAVAEVFKISEYYLSRSFKNQFGATFYNYLEDVRIARAEVLLEKTDRTVREISESVGYGSSSSFCRTYRKRRGISPTQFRRSIAVERASSGGDSG